MAGEVASLLLSRMAVPVLFYMSERKKHMDDVGRSDVKTVICATDLSPQSSIALKFASSLAGAFGARLKVLFAHEPDAPPYFTSSQVDEIAAEEKQLEDEDRSELDRFAAEALGPDRSFETVIAADAPASAIFDEAEKSDTVMIALGTHGRGGLDKLRFGSVAGSVLHDGKNVTLVVGPNVVAVETVSIDSIVCPVDLSPESGNALRYAAELARLYKANLSVIRVLDDGVDTAQDDKFNELCQWIPDEVRSGCKVDEVIRKGDFIEQILKEADDLVADVIVIGTSHHLFADKTLGESTAAIISAAQCPVITVPGGRD